MGLSGSGKTGVGRRLSALRGLPFTDLDRAVEAEAGSTVDELFATVGEAGFRALESRSLRKAVEAGPSVIAAGGGCVTVADNRRLLSERCFTVWLDQSTETAAARVAADGAGGRPLLAGDPATRMAVLFAERRAFYEACADIVVSTEGRTMDEVAGDIHGRLG